MSGPCLCCLAKRCATADAERFGERVQAKSRRPVGALLPIGPGLRARWGREQAVVAL